MLIIDEKSQDYLDDVNDGDGYFYTGLREFETSYRIDAPAVMEEQVVKEYPNGGKDIEFVIVKPETGHWKTIDSFGRDVSGLVEIPDYILKEKNSEFRAFFAEVQIFHQWTKEDFEKQKLENEQKENRERLDEMILMTAEDVASIDDALCHLYEENLLSQKIIADQDEAICALYEMIGAEYE